MPRRGGECHPLTSPDRPASHEMTLSTRTRDASLGLHILPARPSITPAVARGTRPTNLSLTAGPFPLSHGHALSCLLLLLIVVTRCTYQSFPSPARRRMLPRPSTMSTTKRWFGSRTCPSIGRTSHLEHRGLFRRCYCPGATVFGHDHRPKYRRTSLVKPGRRPQNPPRASGSMPGTA
ncbi:hypothetical protein F5883DRAFT_43436 [Diaporthe sp. PMI_573]|nr:hypothetical protein F5883DRAFT_43436 [Diaporthaceae sp. PMI_573]